MKARVRKHLDPHAGAVVLAGTLVDGLTEIGILSEETMDEIEAIFPHIAGIGFGKVQQIGGKMVTEKTAETFRKLQAVFEELLICGETTSDTLCELRMIRPVLNRFIAKCR